MRRRDLLLLLALAAPAGAAPLDDLRASAARTRDQIVDRLDEHDLGLRERVRILYKLSVFGDLPLWVDEQARADTLHRRGAARRLILRDLEERRLLRDELDHIESDLERLEGEAARARELAARPLRDHILTRPTRGNVVASFGPYKDESTHVRLQRRGLEMGARDPEVVAAGSGQVTYAGPVRSLGIAVVVDHGQGLVSITGGLASAQVARGDQIAAGDPVGRAAGNRISLEVRHAGRPVDPVPLLRAKH